jgi:hypothetical protein
LRERKQQEDGENLVGFEVLTAVSKKLTVFWVIAPCSLVGEQLSLEKSAWGGAL